jgi:ribosomal protein L27
VERLNPFRLFKSPGLPVGISFLRQSGTRPNAIRVTGCGKKDTMFTAANVDFYGVYQRAVEHRLSLIGREADAELRAQMLGTFGRFCEHYQIVLVPRLIHVIAD